MVKRILLQKLLHCKRLKRKAVKDQLARFEISQSSQVKIKQEAELLDESNNTLKSPLADSLDLCRVCLKNGYIPIFGDDTNEDFSGALSTIANITMSANDEHPKHLCKECHSLLRGAMLLRKTAEKTENLLSLQKQELFTDEHFSDVENQSYSEHEELVKQEKYNCNICNLEFTSLNELVLHRRTPEHRNVRQKCSICDKEYSAIYFKRHMACHKGHARYMCDVCGKSFLMKGHFTRHKQTHGFELPYHCHLCPYRGRFSNSLKLHIRTHTGDKPYLCPECPQRCISKSNLNKHMLTHSKTFNYRCDACGKGFYSKRDLETHITVDHTGLKEHVCNICGKAFGYRKQMMKHQLKVHKRAKLKGGRMPTYLLIDHKKELGENIDLEPLIRTQTEPFSLRPFV